MATTQNVKAEPGIVSRQRSHFDDALTVAVDEINLRGFTHCVGIRVTGTDSGLPTKNSSPSTRVTTYATLSCLWITRGCGGAGRAWTIQYLWKALIMSLNSVRFTGFVRNEFAPHSYARRIS